MKISPGQALMGCMRPKAPNIACGRRGYGRKERWGARSHQAPCLSEHCEGQRLTEVMADSWAEFPGSLVLGEE